MLGCWSSERNRAAAVAERTVFFVESNWIKKQNKTQTSFFQPSVRYRINRTRRSFDRPMSRLGRTGDAIRSVHLWSHGGTGRISFAFLLCVESTKNGEWLPRRENDEIGFYTIWDRVSLGFPRHDVWPRRGRAAVNTTEEEKELVLFAVFFWADSAKPIERASKWSIANHQTCFNIGPS